MTDRHSLFHAPDDERDILTAEAEAIVERDVAGCFAGDVRHIIEVAERIRVFVIDGGWQNSIANGHQANNQFGNAGSSDQMSHHAFRTGDRHVISIFAEYLAAGE